jgi:RNA polymerase sigma-70 factor (ECF subfamily)
MARDRSEADELTQETFVRVWERLGSFRGDSAFSTWLHRVTVNVVIAALRRRGRWRERFAEQEADDLRAAPPAFSAGGDLDLERAIAALSPQARLVFVLHDVEGYQHHEIAERPVAVEPQAHLHRARRLLRGELSHDGRLRRRSAPRRSRAKSRRDRCAAGTRARCRAGGARARSVGGNRNRIKPSAWRRRVRPGGARAGAGVGCGRRRGALARDVDRHRALVQPAAPLDDGRGARWPTAARPRRHGPDAPDLLRLDERARRRPRSWRRSRRISARSTARSRRATSPSGAPDNAALRFLLAGAYRRERTCSSSSSGRARAAGRTMIANGSAPPRRHLLCALARLARAGRGEDEPLSRPRGGARRASTSEIVTARSSCARSCEPAARARRGRRREWSHRRMSVARRRAAFCRGAPAEVESRSAAAQGPDQRARDQRRHRAEGVEGEPTCTPRTARSGGGAEAYLGR